MTRIKTIEKVRSPKTENGYHQWNRWCRYLITLTGLAPHLFLMVWLKLNLILLLNQLNVS